MSGVDVGVGVRDSRVTDGGTKVKVGLKTRNVTLGTGRLAGVGVDIQDTRTKNANKNVETRFM